MDGNLQKEEARLTSELAGPGDVLRQFRTLALSAGHTCPPEPNGKRHICWVDAGVNRRSCIHPWDSPLKVELLQMRESLHHEQKPFIREFMRRSQVEHSQALRHSCAHRSSSRHETESGNIGKIHAATPSQPEIPGLVTRLRSPSSVTSLQAKQFRTWRLGQCFPTALRPCVANFSTRVRSRCLSCAVDLSSAATASSEAQDTDPVTAHTGNEEKTKHSPKL